MKLTVHNEKVFDHLALSFAGVVRVMLSVLLVITITALGIGIVKSGIDLFNSVNRPLETILQAMLLDVVFIVALLEITMTIIGYLDDGRVHVRYIIDTILIIMLNEIVTMWFKHPKLEYAISLSVIVVSLSLARIAVIKFPPRKNDD
ncbi:phosphate-starvation-inducible PsiE family protein [Aeromicrobium sp.]|nr:phosphate-starvation-inducible PsiE family protein [Candidatus Saccharibacteria bacterium]